mmetsp:Transcript_44040/g.138977  ORF Transcript_44040/g.138977 Transcript_44040/m.138977 type:complete len:137 (+) Transcript_44040:538-948(+)
MFDLIYHAHIMLAQNPSYVPLGPNEHYNTWTPSNNSWQPNADPGDNWVGANNPFGPKIPLGAHGSWGSAPPAGGWSSGECNFNGQAQCGRGPAPMVATGHGWGVVAPPSSGLGSGEVPNAWTGPENPYGNLTISTK